MVSPVFPIMDHNKFSARKESRVRTFAQNIRNGIPRFLSEVTDKSRHGSFPGNNRKRRKTGNKFIVKISDKTVFPRQHNGVLVSFKDTGKRK